MHTANSCSCADTAVCIRNIWIRGSANQKLSYIRKNMVFTFL